MRKSQVSNSSTFEQTQVWQWCLLFFFFSKKKKGMSNSRTQREYIEEECNKRGFKNTKIITSDINTFDIEASSFDLVISIEMFEHLKNIEKLYGHRYSLIFAHLKQIFFSFATDLRISRNG